MTSPKRPPRSVAILDLPASTRALVARAQAIVASLARSPYVPSPVPSLAVVSAALTNLQKAEAAALTRVDGAVAARDDRRTILVSLLHQLRGCVQVAADSDPKRAAAIVKSAGMTLKKEPRRAARVFSAQPGSVSGEVKLVAPRAAKESSYEWQYSVDDGVTWLSMPVTMQASTRLAGLTPATSVTFRYRPVTRKGTGEWSSEVSMTVR